MGYGLWVMGYGLKQFDKDKLRQDKKSHRIRILVVQILL